MAKKKSKAATPKKNETPKKKAAVKNQEEKSAIATEATTDTTETSARGETKAPVVVEFRTEPTVVTCPHCKATAMTETSTGIGWCTWIVCWIIFVTVLCCLYMWLPFCLDCTKDTIHKCSKCGQYLGRARRCNKY